MGFSIKLAPGVRVRASSRGLRTSVGPRAARVHVGAGRTTFSTGAGPVGFSTGLGSGGSRQRPSSTAASSRALAAAAKADEAQALLNAIDAVLQLHRPSFPAPQRPIAPAPPAPNLATLLEKHRKAALQGIGIFNRQAREHAKMAAEHAAHAEAAAIAASDQQLHSGYQAHLDDLWNRLLNNDPDTVLSALAEAFEDNEAAAAPLGVHNGEVSLVVLVPPSSAVPERRPTTTAAGNLSLKKLTKREASDLYRQMIAGYTLVTVKEALAVAPQITHVRIVALRTPGKDVYGKTVLEAVLTARFARSALEGVLWEAIDAETILQEVATELTVQLSGPSKNLIPLDLATEPEVAAVIAAVDAAELSES